eukprot:m.29885 g.29885  ORF g.29885 m.29885 type:complete len:305 (+) comp12168_c0_seq1:323-1237(+)
MSQRVYMEGWVEKKAGKWKKYYAVVLNRKIYFFKTKNTDDKEQMVGHLDIGDRNCVTEGETKKKYAIFELTSQTVYQLRVPSADLRAEWIYAIQKSAEEPTIAAEVSGGGGGPPPVPTSARPAPRSMSTSSSSRPLPAVPPGGASVAPPRSSSNAASTAWQSPQPDPNDAHSMCSWHFGRTTRLQSEKLLERHGSEGSFLLRASESTPGDFTLSVLDQGAPRHYKITASSRGLLLTGCEDEAFGDLQILVDYYVKASKGRSNPLDKGAVEKLESAFDAPVVRIEGLILPGMRIQMEEEERANRQ